jgi:hypothetical protein
VRGWKGIDRIKPCKGTSWNWVQFPASPPMGWQCIVTTTAIVKTLKGAFAEEQVSNPACQLDFL